MRVREKEEFVATYCNGVAKWASCTPAEMATKAGKSWFQCAFVNLADPNS